MFHTDVVARRREIRVLLADDHAVLRAGLRALLEREPGLVVVGEAGSGSEAVALAKTTRPDVVLMDIAMPGKGGIEATRRIVALGLGAKVLVLTALALELQLSEALEAGASGFMQKVAPVEELTRAIRAVADDRLFLDEDAARLDVAEGEVVQVSSRRGTIRVPARRSEAVAVGTVFMPFHWGDLFAQGQACNYLTIAATDTASKQPELKFCAVAVEIVVSLAMFRFAAEAPRLRLNAGVLLLPLLSPLHVAEEFATLDVITNGKIILGVGLGYRDVEFKAFGVPRSQDRSVQVRSRALRDRNAARAYGRQDVARYRSVRGHRAWARVRRHPRRTHPRPVGRPGRPPGP